MKRDKVDSLIIVMIPIIPRYDSSKTHHGATGEEEERSYKNMLQCDKELLKMAKEDLEFLKTKQKKKQFGQNFSNAALYPEIVFLGQSDGKNSIGEAIKFVETKHKCKKEEIKNLGINITAHGNPSVIGTKLDVSIDPDGKIAGLASLINDYISGVISENTRISFYLLSCNSAYVDYSEDESDDPEQKKERIKKKLLSSSYAGRFFSALAQENNGIKITVSGYRGFLSHHGNKIVSMAAENDNTKIADAECVRIVFSNINTSNQFEVTVPKNYKFNVIGVTSGITSQQAINYMVAPAAAVDSSASVFAFAPTNLPSPEFDAIDIASSVAFEGRKTLEEILKKEKVEKQLRMQLIGENPIFSEYLQHYKIELGFIANNADWFEYVMKNEDHLKQILDFLHNTEDLDLFQIMAETFTPLDYLCDFGMNFEELAEYFTYNLIYMMISDKISFKELIEIKKVDENLFDLLGSRDVLGSLDRDISVRDAIQTYIEMAKKDRQLDPAEIFAAAINYENDQIDELPFQFIECSGYYVDLSGHKATEISDDDSYSTSDDDEVVINLNNPNSNSLFQLEFERLAGIDVHGYRDV